MFVSLNYRAVVQIWDAELWVKDCPQDMDYTFHGKLNRRHHRGSLVFVEENHRLRTANCLQYATDMALLAIEPRVFL